MSYIKNNYLKSVGIAVNKSLLKEYHDTDFDYSSSRTVNTVYMNDRTEFQIMLFNKNSLTCGYEIFINNMKISNSYIILRPGERVWLERFIDTNNKFVFNTYEVVNNSSLKEVIKNNGNIIIKEYREKPYYNDYNICDIGVVNFDSVIYDTPKYFCGDIKCGTNSCVNNTAANTALTYNDSTVTSANYSSVKTSTLNTASSDKLKTGRIEHGNESKQEMHKVYGMNFEYMPINTYEFKILPSEQKPIYKNDIQKRFCHNCGKKINPKFKFCPSCGAKQ